MRSESIVDIALSEMSKMGIGNEPSLEEIYIDCCNSLNLSPVMVRSKCRIREYVLARRIITCVCKAITTKSMREIAALIGANDHTSVVANLQMVETYIANNDYQFMSRWRKYKASSKIWNKYK